MKTFVLSTIFSVVCVIFSGSIVSAQASQASQSITVDVGIVTAMISVVGAVIAILVGVARILGTFEAIRTRLSVLEAKIDAKVHEKEEN